MPGWLGANTPNAMAVSLLFGEEELPCHTSIDYDDPKWLAKWNAGTMGSRCVGSLIILKNHCKRPKDPDYATARDLVDADAVEVFARIQEFIDHHNAAPTRSWEL